MTPRTPPHRTPAWHALLAGALLTLWSVGCTEPPAPPADAAHKDAAAERVDLGVDAGNDAPDAASDAAPEATSDEPTPDGPFLPEDIPATYDVQLDRSWAPLADGALAPADVSALLADRPPPDRPGVPCEVGVVESCACTDGRDGWQVCEHTREFSACTCAAPSTPPSPLPPRLVHPLSGSRVTSQRPTLRWVLPDGVTRARVELCADRPCARPLGQQEVAGNSWRLTSRLAPGVVFWQVRGLDASGAVVWTSPTWLFQVRARDAEADTAYGRIHDFNGDGCDDIVVAQYVGERTNSRTELWVFFGSPRGIGPRPELVFQSPTQDPLRALSATRVVADLTGDGLADLLVYLGPVPSLWDDPRATWEAYVYEGHRTTPLGRRIVRLPLFARAQTFVVDHNADGFTDLLGYGFVSWGGPDGPSEPLPEGLGPFSERDPQISAVADTDGDGFVEYIDDHESYRPAYGRLPLRPRQRWPLPPTPCFNDPVRDPRAVRSVVAGDTNGDGYVDLMGYCRGGDSSEPREFADLARIFSAYGGAGVRTRSPLQITAIPLMYGDGPYSSSSGDFNGDGLVDHLLDVDGLREFYSRFR